MLKRWTLLMLTTLLLVACGTDDTEEASEDTSPATETTQTTETTETTPEPETTETLELEVPLEEYEEAEERYESKTNEDEETLLLEALFLGILEDNFAEIASVEFLEDEKIYKLTPYSESVAEGAVSAYLGNSEVLEAWNGLMKSMEYMSDTLYEEVGPGYTIALVNPVNTELILAVAMDGEIVYDPVND